ncbi:transducin-like enhancer protein 4 [Paramacrobiotus metropolitanus]|uniref:transducin-like enhancer protein 4 n=1 Tax=Paramacrobiotus metropolitanus TaxID=2943436 RepID=UPI0024464A62|nr:transducin-like enhancer protein 4 [Paramacrobiotus metropolitanus]
MGLMGNLYQGVHRILRLGAASNQAVAESATVQAAAESATVEAVQPQSDVVDSTTAPIQTYPHVTSPQHPEHNPRQLQQVATLNHGEVVCAVIVSSLTRYVFTGSKGTVKMWDVFPNGNTSPPTNPSQPAHELDCLERSTYVRSCKLLPDGNTLVVGGEAQTLTIWDLNGSGVPRIKGKLFSEAPACYALAISSYSKLCYSCCSNGNITVWDLHNQKVVSQICAHSDGASCIDISSNGLQLWTGGLDNTVRSWNIRTNRQEDQMDFPSPVFSLSCCSTGDWLAVGLENSMVEVRNMSRWDRHHLKLHTLAVLSVKYATAGNWLVSAGKDTRLSMWVPSQGLNPVSLTTPASLLCCDVTIDDRYIAIGSGNRTATLYEVTVYTDLSLPVRKTLG